MSDIDVEIKLDELEPQGDDSELCTAISETKAEHPDIFLSTHARCIKFKVDDVLCHSSIKTLVHESVNENEFSLAEFIDLPDDESMGHACMLTPVVNPLQFCTQSSESVVIGSRKSKMTKAVTEPPRRRTQQKQTKTFTCLECGKPCPTKTALEKHKVVHTDEYPHACDKCPKTYKNLQTLKKHQIEKHSNQRDHLCKTCGKGFSLKAYLQSHERIHMDVKPYVCKICGKSFGWRTAFRTHYYTHTGERPFSCPKCPQTFRSLNAMKDHQLIHSEQKPYECEICLKKFKSEKRLATHGIVHTGEKNYACLMCGERFKYYPTMRKHMEMHTR